MSTFFFHVRVCLVYEFFLYGIVAEIWSGKLVAVSVEFADKGRCSINAGSFGIGDFQLVCDKHVEIFVEALRFDLLAVVLVV